MVIWRMEESLICTNCGLEVKPEEVDNSLEICFDCQLNLGILRANEKRVS
jgi:hypothetical protein